ncbi:sensor histidine kinase [Nocardia aurea]|uniref:sensor histidine kinase n=1 Tax=Nocardia aurea TaxID=2144174 RepID=UPI0013002A1A|nr:nitrate- and nitrite sensing domain-containing protein [Nocardia aurea]
MLAIALIPSTALLLTGAIVVTLLAGEARAVGQWFDFRSESTEPALRFVVAIQQERSISLQAINGNSGAYDQLADRRTQTDTALVAVSRLSAIAEDRFDMFANAEWHARFGRLAPLLPTVRASVDRRQIPGSDIDGFYSELVDVFAESVVQTAVSQAPNNATVTEELSSAAMLRIADMHSRATALVNGGLALGSVDPGQQRTVSDLYSGTQRQLKTLESQLAPPVQDGYRQLIASPEWNLATTGESELAEQGQLSVPYPSWQSAEEAVNARLLDLFDSQISHAVQTADDAARTSVTRTVWVGLAVLLITASTLGLAVVLARRLVARLRALRSRSLHLAHDTLPALIQRIHDGESIDLDTEIGTSPIGNDEIDQVAEAFDIALRTAVTTAVDQARTRSGFAKVFLDIAYRNQAVVRKQLEVLDIAESKQNDPEHLQLLFDLDHLTTRARRNAENLLILGGGQAGRRWRQPVLLEDVVRSAVSETENMARVGAVRIPEALVSGGAVADLIHLLAELIDNAATFSPPEAPVSIHGNSVGRGVVIEVEDQGLGIRFEERERLNETLRNPPDFHEMALEGRRHLGLFVVGRLAQRHSITVNLQESAYGGIKSIILIPTETLQATDAPRADRVLTAKPPRMEQSSQKSRLIPHEPAGHPEQVDPHTHSSVVIAESPRRQPLTIDAPVLRGRPASADRMFAPPVTRNRAPLPQRERQTHMARELQPQRTDTSTRADVPARERSADFARGSMAAFQSGTRQGRASTTDPYQ